MTNVLTTVINKGIILSCRCRMSTCSINLKYFNIGKLNNGTTTTPMIVKTNAIACAYPGVNENTESEWNVMNSKYTGNKKGCASVDIVKARYLMAIFLVYTFRRKRATGMSSSWRYLATVRRAIW